MSQVLHLMCLLSYWSIQNPQSNPWAIRTCWTGKLSLNSQFADANFKEKLNTIPDIELLLLQANGTLMAGGTEQAVPDDYLLDAETKADIAKRAKIVAEVRESRHALWKSAAYPCSDVRLPTVYQNLLKKHRIALQHGNNWALMSPSSCAKKCVCSANLPNDLMREMIFIIRSIVFSKRYCYL